MKNTVVVILLVLCLTTLTGVGAGSFCGTGLVNCDGMSRIRRALCNELSMCGDKLNREKREVNAKRIDKNYKMYDGSKPLSSRKGMFSIRLIYTCASIYKYGFLMYPNGTISILILNIDLSKK